jgi:hypothetical protein
MSLDPIIIRFWLKISSIKLSWFSCATKLKYVTMFKETNSLKLKSMAKSITLIRTRLKYNLTFLNSTKNAEFVTKAQNVRTGWKSINNIVNTCMSCCWKPWVPISQMVFRSLGRWCSNKIGQFWTSKNQYGSGSTNSIQAGWW